MSRQRNLEVDEAEYQRVKRLIIGKATRYQLDTVRVSDRLVTNFNPEQIARLVQEVASAGHALEFKAQQAYTAEIAAERQSASHPVRFGAEPRESHRHPMGPHWAGEEAGGTARKT